MLKEILLMECSKKYYWWKSLFKRIVLFLVTLGHHHLRRTPHFLKHLVKQGDSRNVSRPLGRNPIRWSKVKLVFEALQMAGKSLLTPVGDLWPWSDLQHDQKLRFPKKLLPSKFGRNHKMEAWSKVMPVFKALQMDTRMDGRTANGSLSLCLPPMGSTKMRSRGFYTKQVDSSLHAKGESKQTAINLFFY